MRVKVLVSWFGAVVAFGVSASTGYGQIDYQFLTVNNPGNASDPATGGSYGSVSYAYCIGKFDVALSQYAGFLNAVAQADPYGLYNPQMGTNLNIAGISRTLLNGSYVYSVIGDGQRPVTYVSWFDAARFANWLHNGQPAGMGEVNASTEDGAYTLQGATSGVIFKNAAARYWIPTEDEWYKAAYYDPALNGGAGGYWTYATRSNTTPGNVVGGSLNEANYIDLDTRIYSVTQSSHYSASQNYLSAVGAFSNSASAYGTYDQNGNVWNWNDAVVNSVPLSVTNGRGLRGGAWNVEQTYLASSAGNGAVPTSESNAVGFRIATSAPAVPVPAMPRWGQVLLVGVLLGVASRSLSRSVASREPLG